MRRSISAPARFTITVVRVWPGRRARALACSYTSWLLIGVAAVSVKPLLIFYDWGVKEQRLQRRRPLMTRTPG